MSSKQRYYAYDFVRAVAAIMVVMIHSLPGPGDSPVSRWYDSIMRVTLLLCNVLFFMLSGRLNLRARNDAELPDYYYRKITKVLLPVLVYIFLETIYEQISWGTPIGEGRILWAFICNAIGDYSGRAHWFIMSLFGMLLAAPIIAPTVQEITPGRKRAFISLFLLFTIPPIFLCKTNHGFGWSYPLATFFGIFLFGALIDLDYLSSIERWKIALPTISCIAISATLQYLGFPHHPVNDNTPMYYIAGAGLLVLLYGMGKEMRPNHLVSLLAKHSFGIYLCHDPFLALIRPIFDNVPMPLRHWGIAACTVTVALVFAALVDTLVVGAIQKLTDKVWASQSQPIA